VTALVEIRRLDRHFEVRRSLFARAKILTAVNQVSFDIERGEILGVVGESGCGKSTLARLVLRLIEPTAGSIRFDGIELTQLSDRHLRRLRPRMQMVFQDPYSSLDPRYTVEDTLLEPLSIQGISLARAAAREKVSELLSTVGLASALARAYPHQLSGGQRQRVGIARALVLSPDLVVLDEPTASLDVSVQAQIVTLLESLQAKLNLTYLFISHDLALVSYFCDRIAVMYLGSIVEILPAVRTQPKHHYTLALMESALIPDPRRRRPTAPLAGDVLSPFAIPAGCAFASRCAAATHLCGVERPLLKRYDQGHLVACHHPVAACKSSPQSHFQRSTTDDVYRPYG